MVLSQSDQHCEAYPEMQSFGSAGLFSTEPISREHTCTFCQELRRSRQPKTSALSFNVSKIRLTRPKSSYGRMSKANQTDYSVEEEYYQRQNQPLYTLLRYVYN